MNAGLDDYGSSVFFFQINIQNKDHLREVHMLLVYLLLVYMLCWLNQSLYRLAGGDDQKSDRNIHEEERVKGECLSLLGDSRTDEWIGSPGAPEHGNKHDNHPCYEMDFEQANQGSYVQRKQAVAQKAEALEKDYFPSLLFTRMKVTYLLCMLFFSEQMVKARVCENMKIYIPGGGRSM